MSSGFVNLLKPAGVTSHDMVNAVRRIFSTRAVGHMGTLDPGAAGVLPLAVNKATRLIPYVEGSDKRYRAEVCLGISTNTEDLYGQVIERKSAQHITESDVQRILASFVGELEQVPPMFSALKRDGVRLYELARQGVEVPRKPRSVIVHTLELKAFHSVTHTAKVMVDVWCSKGTYVRSLCRDIGLALGVPACMGFLLRQASGPFALQESVTLSELEGKPCLIAPEHFFPLSCRQEVSHDEAIRFLHGQRLATEAVPGMYAVMFEQSMLGIGRVEEGVLSPVKVLLERGELGFDRQR